MTTVCGLRARMMYSTFSNASAKANCGCGAMLGREESLSSEYRTDICVEPNDQVCSDFFKSILESR